MSYSKKHLLETKKIVDKIDESQIENLVSAIKKVKINKGRLFFLGVGGSAGNCSHAVNDFRKIIGIESYAPTDNVSELNQKDAIFIFSVGGGSVEKNISINLVSAINYAKEMESKIFSIVGKSDGYAANNSDNCIIIPEVNSDSITPHSEAFQSVIWHLLVSHPELKTNETKWEQIAK